MKKKQSEKSGIRNKLDKFRMLKMQLCREVQQVHGQSKRDWTATFFLPGNFTPLSKPHSQ